MPTYASQKKAFDKYRRNNLEYYADAQKRYYQKKWLDPEFKEKENARLRNHYHVKKEFKAFLNILLENV